MDATVLATIARPLILVHSVCAILLVGASTRHALVAIDYGRGRYKVHVGHVFAATTAALYVATMTLGALVYPTYRYYVRGGYLDRHALWASRLFDVKEDLAVLGALAAVGAWILSSAVDAKSDRAQRTIYAALVWIVPAVVWFDVFSGLVITMVRSV